MRRTPVTTPSRIRGTAEAGPPVGARGELSGHRELGAVVAVAMSSTRTVPRSSTARPLTDPRVIGKGLRWHEVVERSMPRRNTSPSSNRRVQESLPLRRRPAATIASNTGCTSVGD